MATEKRIKENIKTEFESGLTLIRRYDTTIPVLEIRYKNTVGYLSPFRRYRFQVSATADGEKDMGSIRVITGLANLGSDELLEQAKLALYDWARCNYHGDIREVIFSRDLLGLIDTDPLISWIKNDVKDYLCGFEGDWKLENPDDHFKEAWEALHKANNHANR